MRVRLRARGCLLAAAVIAGFVPSPALVAQTPVKRVLIIHGGPESFPGNAEFDATIRQSLYSHPAIHRRIARAISRKVVRAAGGRGAGAPPSEASL